MVNDAHVECPYRPECDGCPMFEVAYAEQLDRKHQMLRRALDAHESLAEHAVADVHGADRTLAYRNRARMVVTDSRDPADKLGFFQAGSREVLPVAGCLVHHETLEEILAHVRSALADVSALGDFARIVDVRSTAGHADDGESAIVTFSGHPADEPGLSESRSDAEDIAARLDEAVETDVSVHVDIDKSPDSGAVLGGRQETVAGDDVLHIEVGDHLFDVPPQAFFQVNVDQLEVAHDVMREHLPKDTRLLLDLYCGVGVHGIALAPPGVPVAGVDAAQAAIDAARFNADRAVVDASFECLPDDEGIEWIASQVDSLRGSHAKGGVAAIANPGRTGMAPELVYGLGDTDVDRVLYLSCEPQTLARDLGRFGHVGFGVDRIEAFDFMPRTEQVETLAVVSSGAEPTRRDDVDYAFCPQNDGDRHFSRGVSGAKPSGDIAETEWIALVAGQTPGHGFLPKADVEGPQDRIQIDKLRNVGDRSVLRISAETADDIHIRKRLRAWHHPVIGDDTFGDRHANHLARRHDHLDRIALHCLRIRSSDDEGFAPVPGHFLALMRLPRHVLEQHTDD